MKVEEGLVGKSTDGPQSHLGKHNISQLIEDGGAKTSTTICGEVCVCVCTMCIFSYVHVVKEEIPHHFTAPSSLQNDHIANNQSVNLMF